MEPISDALVDMAVDDLLVNSTPIPEEPHLISRVHHIPDSVPDEIMEEFFRNTKSKLNRALEKFQGSKQHEITEIGDQQDGLCTKFGIKKEEYLKRWECLFHSLKNTFTDVTAVESTVERMSCDSCLKSVVGNCITKNLCPATSIGKSEVDLEDPHAKHIEMVESGPLLIKDSMPEVFSLYSIQNEMYPDIIDKAWQLLELLSTTHAPVSLGEYRVQWECLRHSLQYYNVAAVANTSLELLKQLVVNCFLHNVCPGTVCAAYDSVSRGLENIEDPCVKHM
ncbi:hypothetical protein ACLB2K_045707 [Fragaria x ananassa]